MTANKPRAKRKIETALPEKMAKLSAFSCSKLRVLFVTRGSRCGSCRYRLRLMLRRAQEMKKTRGHDAIKSQNPFLDMHPVIKVSSCDLVALEEEGHPTPAR